jgi:protease-4
MSKSPGFFRRLMAAFWNSITRVRVALSNILFIALLVFLFTAFRDTAPEPLPEQAALVLNPTGRIVEQKSYADPMQLLFSRPMPSEREVLLKDVLDAIDFAREDPHIAALVLELDQLYGVGVSKSSEIIAVLEEFRASGKPIIAWGDQYSQGQYLLASQADTVLMHPLGALGLEGFGSYQWYFRDLLDKLQLSMHVFRAGEHKSVAEPFLRNDMSPAEKDISLQWLSGMWDYYTASVEARRGLPAGAVDDYIENQAAGLRAAGGDQAQLALDRGLVDKLKGRREANDFLVEIVGAKDEDGNFEAVGFEGYLQRKRPTLQISGDGPKVGVVVAQGTIQDGTQPAGSIGGDSLAALLRQATEDETIKAIVLRVDSGGGSAFASEIIRQRLLHARAAGKPVVVSMGSVAASGGYWIAAPADQIWATATTITGSIGVFAAFPTIDKLLGTIGVYTDGIGTTTLAGAARSDRPLNPAVAEMVQNSVDNIYQRFVGLVAEGRGMTSAAVDEIARGRVWNAADAQRLGLVDELGGLRDAIASAAKLAQLDDYEVELIARPLSAQELLLRQLVGQVQALGLVVPTAQWSTTLHRLWAPLEARLEVLGRMNDPSGMYAQCLVCLEN